MDSGGRILFVDDDASLRTVVSIALARDGHTVATAENGDEALAAFAPGRFDLVIQDVRMPGMRWLELLEKFKTIDPDVPVVVMTAFSAWDVAVDAMRLGAFDYLKKPFDNDELRVLARRAVAYGRERGEAAAGGPQTRILGGSPGIKAVRDLVRRVAKSDSTVLIEGESGTGKELAAALLHTLSPRRDGPFLAVNCGGFSETLLESELFGHVRGAFTGAVADKRGLLELADGGTFFLDEIAETSASTQVRLLRALETKTFMPVGGEEPRRTDARFVAATNRDLGEMAAAGAFRSDLYYRLNVIPVRMPPLRERGDDIPLLAGYFLSVYSRRFNRVLDGFEPAAMDAMRGYAWPGNVRELQNAVQRAVSLAEGRLVAFDDVFPGWSPLGKAAAAAASGGGGGEAVGGEEIGPGFELESRLAGIEAGYVRRALAMTGNNLTQAAELLGISFRSMRYKMKKLKLDR